MYVYPYPFLRLRLPRAHCSSALIIRNEATPAHSNAAFGAASRRGRSQAPRLRRRSSRGSAERKHRNTALHKRWRSRPGIPPFRGLGRTDPWMTPLWSRSAKDFRPRVKQMLTRAAVACLIEPNARKAYPLALSRVRPATIRGPHLPIGRRPSSTLTRGRGGRGQMSAIEAIVITALGTVAAVVWALCLEASRKKSRPRG